MAGRRTAELERSAQLLGVSRVVLLGRRDSGLPGWADGAHPKALATACASALGRRVAAIAEAESAGTLIFDDEGGVYGHPDHSAAHRIGEVAARLTGAATYRFTVDRAGTPDGHLVRHAAGAADVRFGRHSEEITFAVTGTDAELAAKRAAMTAHASQIGPEQVPSGEFAATYGTEWFRHHGRPGALSALLSGAAAPLPAALAG
jgi:LmbE family N-acetylglucosaminyl deacetylase